jgi:long-chain fatty acid transport protein
MLPKLGLASGLTAYEQGQPSIGTASVGQAAYAEDASIAYFNPAGMTHLERSEIEFGSQLMVYTAKFRTDNRVTNPFTGNDGGNAGMTLPGGGLYVVQKLFKGRAAAGLAINAPAGFGINYDHGWKGRYNVQEAMLAVANINPSIAFKVTNWLSVGAGLSVYYAMLKDEMAILTKGPEPDGSLKVTATDWRLGYNLGVLLEPRKGTRIGVAYRSQADFILEGKGKTKGIGPVLTAAGVSGHPGMDITLPIARSIVVSGYHGFTPKWAGLADVGWQNWSAFNHQTIRFPQTAVSINEDWKDTWRLGLGVHYRPVQRLLLKAGFSYDSDPSSLANRLPNLPAAEQWRYATGLDYDLNKNMVISLNYEFIQMGHARIDKDLQVIVPDGTTLGKQFEGDYNQFINCIGASFRWKFGKGEVDSKKDVTENPAIKI